MKFNNFTKRTLSTFFLLPLVIFIIFKGSFLFNMFLLFCFFLSLFEWFKISKKKVYFIFGLIFLSASFICTSLVRNGTKEFNSLEVFLLIFIICIFTDIGGYVFGKIFKGPKLTQISPNKTISGVTGSYFFSLIFGILFIKFHSLIDLNLIIYSLNLEFIILIILISTISQVGDILISLFKRISNIKDTGSIIPGHGGILDRIDGMIFVFPSYYLFNLIF
jgi:phosphatidate cytidylyltransferase